MELNEYSWMLFNQSTDAKALLKMKKADVSIYNTEAHKALLKWTRIINKTHVESH